MIYPFADIKLSIRYQFGFEDYQFGGMNYQFGGIIYQFGGMNYQFGKMFRNFPRVWSMIPINSISIRRFSRNFSETIDKLFGSFRDSKQWRYCQSLLTFYRFPTYSAEWKWKWMQITFGSYRVYTGWAGICFLADNCSKGTKLLRIWPMFHTSGIFFDRGHTLFR